MRSTPRSTPGIAGSIPPRLVQRLHTRLLNWYTNRGRKLPWRGISDPYRILVSEVMLQQTQVSRVLEKYQDFLLNFPSLRVLAKARQRDVVVAWRGMGYNNRAVRLLRCAQAVHDEYRGNIPGDFDALIALPGIGRYTASALLSSAFRRRVPVVDINVRRFLSRVFWRMGSTTAMRNEKEIWSLAASLLPAGRAYRWNQALMDIGATICTARQPRCNECPVAAMCRSRSFIRRSSHECATREPTFHGIPHRLYRGRIIELLRHHTQIRADLLGTMVYQRYSPRNERWLHRLLTDLQRDGLITVRRDGSKTTSIVALA